MNWERLARLNVHPLRIQMLELLGADTSRTLSPKELSRELGQPLGTTSYHVNVLRDQGFLELERTEPRRGALEHWYRLADGSKAAA